MIPFQTQFAVALKVISATTTVKKLLRLHWEFLQLFNLNEMFKCLFPHTISVFPQRNAAATQKILVTHSEESAFLLTSFSRPVQGMQTVVPLSIAAVRADATTNNSILCARNRTLKVPEPVTKSNALSPVNLFFRSSVGGLFFTFQTLNYPASFFLHCFCHTTRL